MRHIAASAEILWQAEAVPPFPLLYYLTPSLGLQLLTCCGLLCVRCIQMPGAWRIGSRHCMHKHCNPIPMVATVSQPARVRVAPALVNWFMRSRKLHPHPKHNSGSIAFRCTVWPEIRIFTVASPRLNANRIWNLLRFFRQSVIDRSITWIDKSSITDP